MPTENEFSTLSEKTQCPVHLTSENVQGNLPQTLSDREGISSGQEKGDFFRFSDPALPTHTSKCSHSCDTCWCVHCACKRREKGEG